MTIISIMRSGNYSAIILYCHWDTSPHI